MSHDLAAIRAKTDLLALIQQTVPLRRTGKEWLGRCPFHDDQHASLSVNPAKGLWRCWAGCKGGDAIDWLMRIENIGKGAAIRRLASELGLDHRHVQSRREGAVVGALVVEAGTDLSQVLERDLPAVRAILRRQFEALATRLDTVCRDIHRVAAQIQHAGGIPCMTEDEWNRA